MKRKITFVLIMVLALAARPAAAQTQVMVRNTHGPDAMAHSCRQVGCNVVGGLDDAQGQLFLVTPTQQTGGWNGGGGFLGSLLGPVLNIAFSLLDFLGRILQQPGVTNAEPDQFLTIQQSSSATPPSGLWDDTPVTYYNSTVWDGYVHQPAAQIIELADVQAAYRVTGSGTVAVIDTGIDPTHPVFKGVLVSGYDFTRNTAGGSELGDVNQSTAAVVDGNGVYPAQLTQSTAAVVDQDDANNLQQPQYADFGHGTMTAGVIHLVAPTAKIMPLKAFHADGTGRLSDVIRATYYAVHHGANVINMSFSFAGNSSEMNRVLNYANNRGIISVASAGNDGKDELVYPAAYTNSVMGVASTDDQDQRSSFSNYGRDIVWVAAPGEAIITTYPNGTYAAAWGTSFSAPFVSGGAALLRSVKPSANQHAAAQAFGLSSKYISPELNHGRLDLYNAVSVWQVTSLTTW
jgi:subtilisin family serine protease